MIPTITYQVAGTEFLVLNQSSDAGCTLAHVLRVHHTRVCWCVCVRACGCAGVRARMCARVCARVRVCVPCDPMGSAAAPAAPAPTQDHACVAHANACSKQNYVHLLSLDSDLAHIHHTVCMRCLQAHRLDLSGTLVARARACQPDDEPCLLQKDPIGNVTTAKALE